jgi:hypothetical protein
LIFVAFSAALPVAWADNSAATPAPAQRSLDLTPPDIRNVMPAEALEAPLADPDEQQPVSAPETVQVKGSTAAPDVPGGIASLWWGLRHPSQAWRILAPAQ